MRWCLSTLGSPKYILPVAIEKGRTLCIGYGVITRYTSKVARCVGNGRVVWSLKALSRAFCWINTPRRPFHLRNHCNSVLPPPASPMLNWVVVVVRNGFSCHSICMDRVRLSPSSPRLAICGPVQYAHPVGLDWTEPDRGLESSGVVESFEVGSPGAREQVYKRSGAAVVKAKQRIQLQKTRQLASLNIPREACYVFRLYTPWNGFLLGMGESWWRGVTSVYTSFSVFFLVFCFSWLF